MNKEHKKKYKNFIKMLKEVDADYIIIASLEVIGDTVEEIKENLRLVHESGKQLAIAENDMILSFRHGLDGKKDSRV